jgi:CheY-like chemotaxis protein
VTDSIQKLLQGIAALLWPLIVILLLYRFRPAIAAIIESAKSRKFTLKIGGQELTMEEANQVQQNLIADLQSQISDIQKQLNATGTTGFPNQIALLDALPPHPQSSAEAAPGSDERPRRISAVLWVDDNPKNNSYFIQQLTDSKVHVDLAETTKAGLELFEANKYDFVISDMGRRQGLNIQPTAGIDLLRQVRAKDKKIPFVIYSSSKARMKYGQEAMDLGATAVLSSPTDLFGILDLGALKGHS